MNKEETKKEETKKEEVKNGTEEVKKDENNNEKSQKPSKSFSETVGAIWNSKPSRFIRKVVKVTLITGGALIGVTGAAKAGAAMAIEEHCRKDSEDLEEIPDEIPETEDVEDIPSDSEDSIS